MYKSFRVQNFRGFKDLHLDDLARVNLIAGRNNTGKTALLEAIAILSGKCNVLLSRTHPTISLAPRGGQSNVSDAYKIKFTASSSFYNFNVASKVLITGIFPDGRVDEYNLSFVDLAQSDTHIENPNLERINLLNYTNGIEFVSPENVKDYILVGEESITHTVTTRRFPLIYSLSRQKEETGDIIRLFSELKRRRRVDLLINALNIIETELQDIQLLDTGLHLDTPRLPELVSLEEMGDGLVRLTNIILAISGVENGILLIDEIENGLHYSVQTDVWRAIAKAAELFNVQIFATTHSFEMIRAAHEAFRDTGEDDFRFYRLFRSEKKEMIDAVSFNPDNMEAAFEMNLEVR